MAKVKVVAPKSKTNVELSEPQEALKGMQMYQDMSGGKLNTRNMKAEYLYTALDPDSRYAVANKRAEVEADKKNIRSQDVF